ncbi:hypothetical protein O181_040165 [Austropuccinia psidii MF-1]|uniref:Uncharacterized protein n=1 Tax=Austropuccinia psidii MF-1 TaxID=1389203 RepID=A0A9Q3DG77_9BASI|nr:hypothetical protein [Austropuccinia psidii MF-1]
MVIHPTPATSHDYGAPASKNNGDSIEEDIQVPMEPSGNQVCHAESENGESGTREEVGNWANGLENIPSQPEGSRTTQNIGDTSHMVRGKLSSQMSSVSRGTTRQDHNLMNDMNTDMKNILSPLILMLQQSQDQVEERD